MPYNINEQRIIATTQTLRVKSVGIERVEADTDGGPEWMATAIFEVLNESGEVVATETVTATGAAFNAFRNNFISAAGPQWLYNRLLAYLGRTQDAPAGLNSELANA